MGPADEVDDSKDGQVRTNASISSESHQVFAHLTHDAHTGNVYVIDPHTGAFVDNALFTPHGLSVGNKFLSNRATLERHEEISSAISNLGNHHNTRSVEELVLGTSISANAASTSARDILVNLVGAQVDYNHVNLVDDKAEPIGARRGGGRSGGGRSGGGRSGGYRGSRSGGGRSGGYKGSRRLPWVGRPYYGGRGGYRGSWRRSAYPFVLGGILGAAAYGLSSRNRYNTWGNRPYSGCYATDPITGQQYPVDPINCRSAGVPLFTAY